MTETTPVTISSSVASEGPIDEAKLRETLDYIRPAVQADGGDLVLLGVEDGAVNIQMVGACGGCPLSMMTLKAGIERILKDRVPGVETVNATADAPGLDAAEVSGGIQIPAL
ncbi:MAG: NifU family protein [Acidobacteria bacterium]|nr:NifU family protein [Acidobacteriota bacterium]